MIAKRPCISIVTPSFGQAEYLGDALDSVASQTYEGVVEHIIIDGGSTDGTLALLSSRPGVTWVSEPDRGQSDALNKGFAMASGDIIGWLNSDDFYLVGALQMVADVFAQQPDVDVVYGDCAFVDGSGRLTRLKAEHGFSRFVLAYFGCYIPTTATFFRRRLLENGTLRILEEYHYVMDFELFMHLGNEGAHFSWLPQTLAAFRWHGQNKSLDTTQRIAERMLVQDLYRVKPRSAFGRRLTHLLARCVHVAMKITNGSIRRQREWALLKGERLQWWEKA